MVVTTAAWRPTRATRLVIDMLRTIAHRPDLRKRTIHSARFRPCARRSSAREASGPGKSGPRLGDDVEVTLIDMGEGCVFGFSKLDVMFGRTTADAVVHPYRDLVKLGVRFVRTTIRGVDPAGLRVQTDAGSFEAGVLMVALGADLHSGATPGVEVEAGREFYPVPGAFATRDVLEKFGGGRGRRGCTSTPFKCLPAPSETALMLHDFLVSRGLRDASEIALVMLLARRSRPRRRRHRRCSPRSPSGAPPGTRAKSCTSSTPSGGSPCSPAVARCFTEGQAVIVADQIIAGHRRGESASAYDGRGICFIEFGYEQIGRVEVTSRMLG